MIGYIAGAFLLLVGLCIVQYFLNQKAKSDKESFTQKPDAKPDPPTSITGYIATATRESFIGEDETVKLINELTSLANRLTVISGKLSSKSRMAGKSGGEKSDKSDDTEKESKKKDSDGDSDDKKKKERETFVDREDEEEPKKKERETFVDREDEEEPKKKEAFREEFTNYSGVESRMTDSYMLI